MDVKADPVKLHKDGNSLCELGKYAEARENFLKAAELYIKASNFFDAAYSLFKAGECSFMLKKYDEAAEAFMRSALLSFEKGYDRFGISALEYAQDCCRALNLNEKAEELSKKIKEAKAKLEEAL